MFTTRFLSASVAVSVAVSMAVAGLIAAPSRWCERRGDRGQATAEYALVVLGAAAVAMLLVAWATSTGKVSTLLNKVIDSVADNIA